MGSILAAQSQEKHDFQSNAKRLGKILTHSNYKDREACLRELLSNASDALEKFRIQSLTDKSDDSPLGIVVEIDKPARTLTIRDNGVGMSKQDLISFLGTLAESGTSKMQEKMENNDMIGQFGVGFYSVYMISDKVTVYSRQQNSSGHFWKSDDSFEGFEVGLASDEEIPSRGTIVILHLKNDADEFLEEENIKKHSVNYGKFIPFPIYLEKTVEVKEEEKKEDSEEKKETEAKKEEESEKEEKKDVEEKKEESKPVKYERVKELLNKQKPIWNIPSAELNDEVVNTFYKSQFSDGEPLGWINFKAEGGLEFKGILFIPPTSPVDLLKSKEQPSFNGIRVSAKNVFVYEGSFLPSVLSFVRGFLDFQNVSMNISRDKFQDSVSVTLVEKVLTRKFFEMASSLKGDKLEKFLKTYSLNLKYECVHHEPNRSKILKILEFPTSKSDKPITLTEYVEKNKDTPIYLAYAESIAAIKKIPYFEKYSDVEVIFLTDPIDEYLIQVVDEFENKKLINIAKDDTADETVTKETKEKFDKFNNFLKTELKSDISEVRLNSKLSTSPFSVLASKFGWTGSFEKMIRSQSGASNNPMLSFMGFQKKILEINPKHPFVNQILESYEKGIFGSKGSPGARIIYDMALLKSGYEIQNVDGFVKRLQDLLGNFMNAQAENEKIKLSLDEAELEKERPTSPFGDMMDNLGKKPEDMDLESKSEGEEGEASSGEGEKEGEESSHSGVETPSEENLETESAGSQKTEEPAAEGDKSEKHEEL